MSQLIKCSAIMLLSALTACGGSSGSNEPPPPPGYTSPSTDYSAAVTHNSVKLVGSFTNAVGYITTSRFEYGTTSAYGSNTPATDYASPGAVSIETNISLLQPSTTYHFRLVTTNAGGTWYGKDNTFTTEALGYPAPSTDYATEVAHNSAKLVGSFSNPSGYTTTSWIEYGTSAAYGSKTADTVYASPGPVNIAVNVSLLQPGTTYHFRLVTSNSGGTWYGKDSTFTTLSLNNTGTTTGNATNVYDTSTTLTGSFANFAGNTTSQWFEYGTTTAYGAITPATDYVSPGTVNIATNVSSLQPDTTYHFRLVTSNTGGTWYGYDNTFKTEALGYTAPTTDYYSKIEHNFAQLVGSFSNPSGYTTTSWIEYGTTAAYGSKTPDIVYAAAGPVNIAANISLLQPGTTYHFRLATSNTGGTWYGQDSIFKTLTQVETGAATGGATNVYDTYATLTGSFLNFAGNTTSQWFEYGTTTAYGATTAATNHSSTGTVNIATNISSLQPNTTYHFRLVTSNAGGTWYGFDNTFTTEALGYTAPTTDFASNVAHNSAKLTGHFLNPVGYPTTSWIEYGTTTAYGSTTLATNYATPGAISVATNISLLQPGTIYHFRLATSNAGGTWYGQDSTFTTLSPNDTGASTGNATNVYDTSATLTGSFANYPGNITSQWFEYGKTNDPSCVTTYLYCATTPATDYASPGTVNVATNISSLQPNTTYHFRLVTLSAGVTRYGYDNTFTTPVTVQIPATIYPLQAPPPQIAPRQIATDATNIYWTEVAYPLTTTSGSVKSMPLAGGAVTTLATGLNAPFGIAVDATSVYFTEEGSGTGTGFVKKVPIGGGATVTLASGLNNPQYIAVDAANVYFTEYGTWNSGYGLQNKDGTINKVPVGGGARSILASVLDGPKAIAIDATSIYWVDVANSVSGAGSVKSVSIAGGGSGCTLTTTITAQGNIATAVISAGGTGYSVNEILNVAGGTGGQALVTSVGAGGAVASVTLNAAGTGYTAAPGVATTSGGVQLLSGLSGSQYIGLDAGSVYYWQEYGILAKVAKAGGAPTVLVTGMSGTQPIAVDGTNVYWADATFGSPLMKIPKSGGNVTVIATGAASPVSMAVDTTNIYWVEFDLATIFFNTNYSGKINKVLK